MVLLGGSEGQNSILTRMSQILALFPLLFLAPVLIYSAPEARLKNDDVWRRGVRWLTLLLAILYLLFIPISFLGKFNTDQIESNKIRRLETVLQNRRKEVLSTLSSLNNTAQFKQALERFPEISNINIITTDPPAKVRADIDRDISRAIKQQLNQLQAEKQQLLGNLSLTVRNLSLGSLVSGLAMLTLASRLLPWLGRLSQAFSNTAQGMNRALLAFLGWASKPVVILEKQLQIIRRDVFRWRPKPGRKRSRSSSSRSRSRRHK